MKIIKKNEIRKQLRNVIPPDVVNVDNVGLCIVTATADMNFTTLLRLDSGTLIERPNDTIVTWHENVELHIL